MPTLMQKGATWLADRLQAAGGEVVTFHPNNSPPLAITAVLKNVEYDVINEAGVLTRITVPVWLIQKTDLNNVVPTKGQRLTRVVSGNVETFEVVPPTKEVQVASLDRTGTIWTVHTQKVNTPSG